MSKAKRLKARRWVAVMKVYTDQDAKLKQALLDLLGGK